MCGRFCQKTPAPKLAKKFNAKLNMDEVEARFNIAPTAKVAVVRKASPQLDLTLESLKWGLIPPGAKDPTIGNKLANARAESVDEKPSFRSAFKKQRCLVPVDGFYEWVQTTKPKQPYYFEMKDGEPFMLGGLWEYWKPKDGKEEPITSFTLITTEANSVLSPVHDRMPVIIDPKDFETWLDPLFQDTEKLKGYLKPYTPSKMKSFPVSIFVNSTRNEGPQCIEESSIKS